MPRSLLPLRSLRLNYRRPHTVALVQDLFRGTWFRLSGFPDVTAAPVALVPVSGPESGSAAAGGAWPFAGLSSATEQALRVPLPLGSLRGLTFDTRRVIVDFATSAGMTVKFGSDKTAVPFPASTDTSLAFLTSIPRAFRPCACGTLLVLLSIGFPLSKPADIWAAS